MATAPERTLVGGVYAIDFSQPLPEAASPLKAFAATRLGQGRYIAISVARGSPARPQVLSALAGHHVPHVLLPLASGPARLPTGDMGFFVICPMPSGAPLSARSQPWSEAEIMEHVLKPAARCLAELQDRNVTHRAIRPGNVFQSAPGAPITLGCAWAAPPACHQPDWIEPPHSAMCLPAGRGDGSIADDVYALGALIVALAAGTVPPEAAGSPRRKLEVGSYAALAGAHRLSAPVADLVRGMLADDPDHRPAPALLCSPATARARRLPSRTPHQAPRMLEIGSQPVWTAPMAAQAFQAEPESGLQVLRNGTLDRWLRQGLGDATTASQLDEVLRLREVQVDAAGGRADATLVMQVAAILDPLGPLVWRSVVIWPDGLGPALNYALHHATGHVDALGEIASSQLIRIWRDRRGQRQNQGDAQLQAPAQTRWRDSLAERLDALGVGAWYNAGPPEAGALRLCYSLNLLAPCESPNMAGWWVTKLADVLPAIEANAPALAAAHSPMVDGHMAAFIAARRDERLDADLNRLASMLSLSDPMSQLRLLARLQSKLLPGALPQLCAWVGQAMLPLLQRYSSRSRRSRLAEQLANVCTAGQLPAIAALLDQPAERQGDKEGLAAAMLRRAAIEASLAQIANEAPRRAERAKIMGHELAGGMALLAGAVAVAAAMLP